MSLTGNLLVGTTNKYNISVPRYCKKRMVFYHLT